jgi:Na+/melibiose symporter-like transporter
MRVIDILVPAACAAIAILSVKMYKITEDRSYEIRKLLQEKRATLKTVEMKPAQ